MGLLQRGKELDSMAHGLLTAAPVFVGLFFLEYPPLFLAGYWSWGPIVHKVLSGVFLILNLAIAEYARKRRAPATPPSPR